MEDAPRRGRWPTTEFSIPETASSIWFVGANKRRTVISDVRSYAVGNGAASALSEFPPRLAELYGGE